MRDALSLEILDIIADEIMMYETANQRASMQMQGPPGHGLMESERTIVPVDRITASRMGLTEETW